MRHHILIIFSIAALIALGAAVENAGVYRDFKSQLQKITLPSPPLQFRSIWTILEKLGHELNYPKEYQKLQDRQTGNFNLKDSISLDSTNPGHAENWRPHDDIPMGQYPSSLIMDQEAVARGVPILSVVADEYDLFDPMTGIIANRTEKGKSWERPCFISYYNQGELLFATGAGLRIHGFSRKPPKSLPLRFYFRSLYGYDQFKPGALFSEVSVPLRQIIARREPNFRNMLAMDLARRIGCLTPEYLPALIYLNGSKYGDSYVLIEHLNDKWLQSRYGHDHFVLLRTTGHKEQRDKSPEYQKLLKWANDGAVRMTMQEVGKRVDIDNLCRWFMSQFYTAGYDMYQGPVILEKKNPDAKWFWINWDMDASFTNGVEPEKAHVWEKENNIRNVMLNPPRDRSDEKTARYQNEDPRAILFRRMHQDDPEFRTYFERLYMDVMNHKLTPQYLEAWFERQSRILLAIQPEERTYLEESIRPFITHRAGYLRGLMQKYFGSEASFSCTLEGLENTRTIIDGFAHEGPYTGWYFKGSTITVAIPDTDARAIDHWTVNGKKSNAGSLDLKHVVDATTTIRPVFK